LFLSICHFFYRLCRISESEWCVDEFVLMVESEAIIIPVSYDVKPTDTWWNRVDGMNGVYAEALRILKEGNNI